MLIGRCLDFFRVLTRFVVLRKQFLTFANQLLDLSYRLSCDILALPELPSSQKVYSHEQLLLAKVTSLQDSILMVLELFWVALSHILVFDHKLVNWLYDVVSDILQKSVYKWSANLLNTSFQPLVVVKIVPLAGEDAQVNCEFVIFTVDNLDEGLLDLLGDIQHS